MPMTLDFIDLVIINTIYLCILISHLFISMCPIIIFLYKQLEEHCIIISEVE